MSMILGKFEEVLRAGKEIGIHCYLLSDEDGAKYVQDIFALYKPQRTNNHLGIHYNSVSLPLEEYEFTYSKYLEGEAAFVFFEQSWPDKNKVVVVQEARKIGQLLEICYGLEYFISNEKMTYFLAVNWYVIEGSGSAIEWLSKLRGARE